MVTTDWDAIIIGGGPAGLTAGLYLCRSNWRTALFEREAFGGPITNYEWIENYPGFPEGISGGALGSSMVSQGQKYGLQLRLAEVTGIQPHTQGATVECAGKGSHTSKVVILASGSRPKKLNIPGEDYFQRKGVFGCALCEGGDFAGKTVAVIGGGDAGVTQALYMTKLASKVFLFEIMPTLGASAVLRERASANERLEIRCGTQIEAIVGEDWVEAVELVESSTGRREVLKVDGVLPQIGLEPNTGYLREMLPTDMQGQVVVNQGMQTDIPCVLAVGDIRSGSPRQIATAVGDGAAAAITAQRILQEAS